MVRARVIEPTRQASAMYARLGASLLELLWLAGASPLTRSAVLEREVVFDDDLRSALRAAFGRGPVVLAASHTGNWELVAYGAAHAFAAYERRLAVVVKHQSVGAFNAFCTKLREACGLTLVAPRGAIVEARRLLARGHAVAMPIDQVPDRARHGVEVPFLGEPALADRGPAALARAAGATLLVTAGSCEGRTQRIHLLAELTPETQRGVTAGAWIEQATRQATLALDAFVRAQPSSWLWLHRRWRAPLEVSVPAVRARAGSLVATRHPG